MKKNNPYFTYECFYRGSIIFFGVETYSSATRICESVHPTLHCLYLILFSRRRFWSDL